MTKDIVFFIQKPIPSVLSWDKNKPEDPGKKIERNFPWVNGLSKTKHIHECRRNIWIFPLKSTDMEIDGKYSQGRENQKAIEERKCLTCLKHMCLGKISTVWNTVMVTRWEGDQLQENLNRLLGKGLLFFLCVLRECLPKEKKKELVKLKKKPFENWNESKIM